MDCFSSANFARADLFDFSTWLGFCERSWGSRETIARRVVLEGGPAFSGMWPCNGRVLYFVRLCLLCGGKAGPPAGQRLFADGAGASYGDFVGSNFVERHFDFSSRERGAACCAADRALLANRLSADSKRN